MLLIDSLDPKDIGQEEFLHLNLTGDAFTAVPSASNAEAVHVANRRLLKMSILLCIDLAGDGLGEDLSPLRQRYRELDTTQKFGPAIYAVQSGLVDVLKTQNVLSVYDALNDFRLLGDDEIFDSAFRAESILSERWERAIIEKVRAERVEGLEENTAQIRPILSPDVSQHLVGYTEAIDVLKEADPDVLAEIEEYITRLKLFIGEGCFAFTSPEMFGAIYLQAPWESGTAAYFLEHLVHETAHLALNGLMLHDPLLTNPLDVHEAPIRPDPRPLFQILHATFVLGRTVRVFRRVAKKRPELELNQQLEDFEEQYAQGRETIEAAGKLTDPGRRVFESMEDV